MSSFAKNFLTSTITSFYTEVETFLKSKNFESVPPLSEFLHYIEFEAESKSKRSSTNSNRGKSSGESKESSETDEKCSFVGSRGGKCKSAAKKDFNGMCKKHFEQASSEPVRAASSDSHEEKTEKKSRSKSKTTVKTGKGLSSVVSKALEDSDREDEPEVKVQSRRTKPIDSSNEENKDLEEKKDSEDESQKKEKKDKKKKEKKEKSKKKDSDESDEEKKSSREKTKKDKKSKKDSENKENDNTKSSYVPITFNHDSTSFVYDENADDGFVYKNGDFEVVYAVRHRGVAVKPTRVHVEEIKKAGKTVGVIEDDSR